MADSDNVPGEPQLLAEADANSRKNYTIHFKRQVLSRFEELGNISSVSRDFGVPRQNIQRWIKKSDTYREVAINQIQKSERRIRRLRKGQGKYTRLEEGLVGYISSEREKGHCISKKSLQRKANLN